MEQKRKLPIGIQSFEKLRKENYLYVDKTRYVWNLINSGSLYFLSRPRRFGKSLFISTLEAYFSGKKELFHDLFIEKEESKKGTEAWKKYPVVHFSLSGGEYLDPEGLRDVLNAVIEDCAKIYHLSGNFRIYGETLPVRFKSLIEQLYVKTGRPVVVLVDEYDKPLLETMNINKAQEEANRQLYKSFFSVLKDEDALLKFVFFTGVTKFNKVSIFSDLNQLRDISLSNEYNALCGITEDELKTNFRQEIAETGQCNAMSPEETLGTLRKMYDGYHFSRSGEGVYNPFSLLNAFQERDFGRYWFETGTPTFLIRKLEASDYTIEDFNDGVNASESAISDYREDNPDPVPLLYQSGYLTISGWNSTYRLYTLTYPNEEVKFGFLNSLLPNLLHTDASRGSTYIMHFVEDLAAGNPEQFLRRLQALLGNIPYAEGPEKAREREWRNQLILIFSLLGQNVKSEVHSSEGRADCIVETSRFIYIFEFKLDKSADEALHQINDRKYAVPYQTDTRAVLKIGVNFSSKSSNIKDWKIEKA